MRYRAFFSYARADDRIANWLHRQLDGYRTPKPLVGSAGELGPVPAKLHPIFRDRTDLESGGHVDAALQAALEESQTLVVLCTPTSAKSHWVNHEVETFQKLGREAAIFPVIAAGTPDSGDPKTECFPPALRGKGLLAADLREIKLPTGQLVGDGREGGRLKLIAGLLGVKLDALVQRERRRQRQVVAALSAAAIVFLTLAVAAAGFGWLSMINGQRAHNRLAEYFATNGWDALARGEPMLAMRYALAGNRAAPANQDMYLALLRAAYFSAGEAEYVLDVGSGANNTGCFSTDGSRIITSTDIVRVWRARDGSAIARTDADTLAMRNVNLTDRCIGSSRVFSRDFRLRVLWENGGLFNPHGHLTVVDTQTNAVIYDIGQTTTNIYHAEFSPDEERIVSASQDGAARIWDARDGRLLLTLVGHQHAVNSAEFSPDGARVVTASDDGTAIIWDARSGRRLATLRGHTGAVASASFSPDGSLVLTHARGIYSETGSRIEGATEDHTSRIWSSETGALMATLPDNVSALWSEDGTRIASVNVNGTASVWTERGALIATVGNVVRTANLSPDGHRLLTVGWDGTAKVWSVTFGQQVTTLTNLTGPAVGAEFSDDDTQLMTWTRNGDGSGYNAAFYEAHSGRRIAAVGQEGRLLAFVGFAGNRPLYATIEPDRTLSIWDARRESPIVTLRGAAVDDAGETRFAITHDGRIGATFGSGEPVQLWDLQNGQSLRVLRDDGSMISGVAFSSDGSRVVTIAWPRQRDRRALPSTTATVWDVRTGNIAARLRYQGRPLLSAVFAPNDETILTTSDNQHPQIWNATTGTLVATLGPEVSCACIPRAVYSSDSRFVATSDGTVEVWNAATGALVSSIRIGGGNPISLAADSGVLVASNGGAAEVWDLGVLKRTAVLPGAFAGVISPIGNRIITLGEGHAQLWDSSRLTQSWRTLAVDACTRQLGPRRGFSQDEINNDPLLRTEWNDPRRDVCENVEGVALRAGYNPHHMPAWMPQFVVDWANRHWPQ